MSGTVLVVGDSSKRNLYLVGISLHTVLSFVCLKEWLFLDIARFFGNRQEAHRGFSLLESDLKKQEISICHWSLFDPGHVSLLSDSFFYIHK